jgi:hypothetical protein
LIFQDHECLRLSSEFQVGAAPSYLIVEAPLHNILLPEARDDYRSNNYICPATFIGKTTSIVSHGPGALEIGPVCYGGAEVDTARKEWACSEHTACALDVRDRLSSRHGRMACAVFRRRDELSSMGWCQVSSSPSRSIQALGEESLGSSHRCDVLRRKQSAPLRRKPRALMPRRRIGHADGRDADGTGRYLRLGRPAGCLDYYPSHQHF